MRICLQRPSLVYQCAFDLCAVEVRRFDMPVIVLASGPFFAREVLKRLYGDVILYPTGDWDPESDEYGTEMGLEVRWDHVQLATVGKASLPFGTAIWTEPQRDDLSDVSDCLANALNREAQVIGITSNWLRFMLPEWKETSRSPAQRPLGFAKTSWLLKRWGFRTQRCYGIQGPVSLAYGFLARLAAMAGREDLADRLRAGMREGLLTERWPIHWTPVSVISAQKGG